MLLLHIAWFGVDTLGALLLHSSLFCSIACIWMEDRSISAYEEGEENGPLLVTVL